MNAQPVVLAASHFPAIGFSYQLHAQDLTTSPPPGGENVTWDFSWLQQNLPEVINIVEPSSTPNGASMNGATVAVQAGPNVQYLSLGPEGILQHGIDATYPCAWEDPMLVLPTSISYDQDYADAYGGECVVTPLSILQAGDSEILADGWGTLAMPQSSYNNVLRVRALKNYGSGIGTPSAFFLEEILDYYAPGVVPAVLSTTRLFQVVGGNQTLLLNSANYILDIGMGISQQGASRITLSPNPAAAHLRVMGDQGSPINHVRIHDAIGALVLELSGAFGTLMELDVEALNAGVYSITVDMKDGSAFGRFVRE